jgi:hypothetical protein
LPKLSVGFHFVRNKLFSISLPFSLLIVEDCERWVLIELCNLSHQIVRLEPKSAILDFVVFLDNLMYQLLNGLSIESHSECGLDNLFEAYQLDIV